jgi:hypothetical protein
MSDATDLLDDVQIDNDGEDATRNAPADSVDQSSQAKTYGDDNVDLPEECQNALLNLIEEAEREDLYQRRMEVCRDRRNRFYERGMQHIYEDVLTGVFFQASPGSWVPNANGEQIQCGSYIGDYNIFARALQIIIAKLTENPPGVDFQPDSGNDSVDLQASKAAEAYRILFDRRNESKDLLTAIVRMMGVSGRTISWTRTIADAQRWGRDEEGEPRQVQITSIYGTLETKVPIMAKSREEWPYCLITEDPHVLIAKKEHPRFADKITEQGDDGIADTQFERLARIGALQGNSTSFQVTDTYAHYVERKYAFFRPSMFMAKCLDSLYAGGGTLRDALNEAFPDGCVCTFIGQTYVASRNGSMDDELAVDFPYAGDGMSRMAVMDPAVVIQDRFNDDMNAYAEVKDFGWPSTWINGEKTQIDAVNDQTASPYCFRPWKSSTRERPLSDQFFREPDPMIPPSFMQHTEYMATQLLQFILAIPSAVQGAGMPDQKTASGYQAALVQAMGQLGVIWGAVQRLMAVVYRQAALAASRIDSESVLVVPSRRGAITLNMSDLGKGHFLAHPDTDSGFPESTMQKRATLDGFLDKAVQDPALGEAILQSPDNWDFISRTYGLSELTFREARVRRKQLAEIELLLDQDPVQPDPQVLEQAQVQHASAVIVAQQTGAPPPPPFDPASLMKSSIQPDELDFHQWEFEQCREFLSDYPKVQQQLLNGNANGVMNVKLHAKEHQAFLMQQAAEAAALAPPPIPPMRPSRQPQAQPRQQPATAT